jgi:hypothetical protein
MCVECAPNPDYSHCPERETLRIRLKADIRVYMDAIIALEMDHLSDLAQKRLDRAHKAYQAARDRFNGHVATHGCGYSAGLEISDG